ILRSGINRRTARLKVPDGSNLLHMCLFSLIQKLFAKAAATPRMEMNNLGYSTSSSSFDIIEFR
ncbi:MAG: hypothetical protein AB3N28_13665, partial [Kordiimonas sp.]